jgi:hypothetical protein
VNLAFGARVGQGRGQKRERRDVEILHAATGLGRGFSVIGNVRKLFLCCEIRCLVRVSGKDRSSPERYGVTGLGGDVVVLIR